MISIYTVSNFMPLLLLTVGSGFNLQHGISLTAYAAAMTLGILILTWEIYRLDKRAGRIQNRVRLFE
jgi:pilus assembly protein TadC